MNEKIIIDGINVINCGYFDEIDEECIIHGYGIDGHDTFCKKCKDNRNCYFKQLQRLKEEEKYLKKCCEEAGKELSKYSYKWDGKEKNLVIQAMELNDKYEKVLELSEKGMDAQEYCLQELEKENEQLKKRLEVADKQMAREEERHFKMQEEIEELKEEIRNYKMYGCSDAVQPNAYVVDSAYQGTIISKVIYEQALEEIRKIVYNSPIVKTVGNAPMVYYSDYANKRNEIITKIDEVLK